MIKIYQMGLVKMNTTLNKMNKSRVKDIITRKGDLTGIMVLLDKLGTVRISKMKMGTSIIGKNKAEVDQFDKLLQEEIDLDRGMMKKVIQTHLHLIK